MKMKRFFGFVLLVFAFGSVIFMLGREKPANCCSTAVPPYIGDSSNTSMCAVDNSPTMEQLKVYYLHGAKRCHTCHLLENYAKDAITQTFSNELANGQVCWEIINVELPENRHYIQDYQLITKSIVLSKQVNGKEASWRNMDKIWKLVGDETTYKQYVTQGVREMLEPIEAKPQEQ